MSAVSSITTGTLPAPTPIAGLPEEYAALTMPGPPVARISAIPSCFISALESSTDGWSIQPMMSFGAPALTAASKTSLAASLVEFFARGCGEKMMPLRVLREIRDLKIAVEVGFVVGTIPQMIPTGSAIVIVPRLSSSSKMPHVFSSLYLL